MSDDLSRNFEEFAKLNLTISELNRKIVQLEDDKHHLRLLLDNKQDTVDLDKRDQRLICLKQLSDLKNISDTRMLTLEETRKAEIFTKILLAISDISKRSGDNLSNKDVGDLLSIVQGGKSSNE